MQTTRDESTFVGMPAEDVDDMKTVLSAVGLTPPPVPVSLVEQFRRLDRWLYATRPLGRGDMYETSLRSSCSNAP